MHGHPASPFHRSRPAWGWALAGLLLGGVASALLCAPAVWVERAVNAQGAGYVRLDDSRGTLWNGSAQFTLAGGAGSTDAVRLPGRVYWALRPGLGEIHVAVNAPCCTTQPVVLHMAPGWRNWALRVDAARTVWPAALLAGLGTPWNTLQLDGRVALDTPGLTVRTALDRWTLDGSLQLEARAISARVSTLRPLGSYRLDVVGGAQTQVTLSTLQGALQLSGQGQWTAGRLHFQGRASASAPHEAELSNLLNILGRRNGAQSLITVG